MRGGDELGGPNSQIDTQFSSDGTVFLGVRDIDLRARQATVSADLKLRLPDVDEEALGTMRVWSGATGVARSGISTQTVSSQIRLRDMYATFAPLPDFKVPLTGSMTAYPHDRYSARFQIEITDSDDVEPPPLPDGTKRMSQRTLMLFISTIKLDDNLSDCWRSFPCVRSWFRQTFQASPFWTRCWDRGGVHHRRDALRLRARTLIAAFGPRSPAGSAAFS